MMAARGYSRPCILICGFPGIGKSWLARHCGTFGLSLLDMDAGDYAWVADGGGNIVNNPGYPDDYIDLADYGRNSGMYDFIFIGFQGNIRSCLTRKKIPFVTVTPEISMKDAYIKKYLNRGDGKDFIIDMLDGWNEMIDTIDDDPTGLFKYVLGHENMDVDDLRDIRHRYDRDIRRSGEISNELPSERKSRHK